MLLRIGVLSLSAALALGCTTSGIKGTTTGAGNNGGGNTSGGGGVTGAGGIKDPSGGPNCGMKTFGLQKVPPDLMIVQDKSGSMDGSPDGMTCRGGCGAMAKWAQM